MKQIDFKQTFGEVPESFSARVQVALRRTQEEEKPVKKFTFRTVLIAAVVMMSMMAVAIAATNGRLVDWFQEHYGAELPKAAQKVLNATEKTVLETDLATFTVNELLCDGKIAYLTAEVQLKEEGTAILYPSASDPTDRIGEKLAAKLNHPGVNAKTSYAEAAKAMGLPLYTVGAWMEIEDQERIDSEMMDYSVLENGNLMLVRMLYMREALPLSAKNLPITLWAQVLQVDVDTLESVEGSRQRTSEAYTLPVHGVTEIAKYGLQEEGVLSDRFRLTGVKAQKTSAGVYVFIQTKADQPMTMDEFFEMNDEWYVLDAQGNRFPTGISLSGEYLDGNGKPLTWDDNAMVDEVQFMLMISVDKMPETLIVTDGTVQVKALY